MVTFVLCHARTQMKPGRNDPCPCGSGKKYKHCCAQITGALQPSIAPATPQLFQFAFQNHQAGNLDAAQALYRQVLEVQPKHLDALHLLGVIAYQTGQYDTAIELIEKAIRINPSIAGFHSNLGAALMELGKLEPAHASLKRAVALDPGLSEAHKNLGLVLKDMGHHLQAATSLERALSLNPDNEEARHLLNALRQTTTERAPASYVRNLFDRYAQDFDQYLTNNLNYQTPALIAAAITHDLNTSIERRLDVLDMGCGTGLFGVEIKPVSRHLTGVDLSPNMVAKAQERGIYDLLLASDLLEFLDGAESESMDLVAATDVFVYIGNLAPIFAQTWRILRPGGRFAFSIETNPDAAKDFVLDKTGRYLHSPGYIDSLISKSGFTHVWSETATLRSEKQQPVNGYLYLLRKE